MIKLYPGRISLLIVTLLSGLMLNAQVTTITTVPNPPFNGGNSLTGPAQVTFVLKNNNPYPILIKGIGNWCTTTENNSVWQLYYTASALSGTSTDVTAAPWALVGTSLATPVTATGITALNFPSLSFTVPAGTQYRFALRNTGPGSCRYSGTGTAISPNTISGGGADLLLGDVAIAGQQVGYSGSGTALTLFPRYFTGFVTFEPAAPCTSPPTPGTVASTANPVCFGIPFTLTINGGSGGTGQTYQWQSSPDNITWTDIGGATNPSLTTSQAASTWYQVQITCGGNTAITPPIQILTPSLVSGTYTINNNLPTGGTNFNSFNAAYNYIKCGIGGPVIFNVDAASGPYNEQLIMTAVPGASAVNTVTFNGNGRTLQFTSTNTNERGVIKLNGTKHITFDNLVINANGTATTEYGFGVHLMNDADSNTVRNCAINVNTSSTSTNYAGIAMSASATSATTTGNTLCDFNTFSNNIITGGYYGITLVGSTTQSVARNRVLNNQFRDQYSYGIYMSGNFNTLVDSNTVSRPTRTTVTTLFSIYATSLNTKLNITRNTITNPFGGIPTSTSTFYGIYFTGVDALPTLENLVNNNTVNNLNGNGDQYGIYNTSSDNVFYYHNTLSMDGPGTSSTASNVTRGFYQTTLAAGIEFKNNLVSITRGGLSNKHALYFATSTSTIISNNNNLYINAPAGTNNTGFFNAVSYATLAAWQAGTPQDANSVAVNPLFASAGTGNLLPTSASMDNLGAPLGITNDIVGNSRSATTPDMGAWEFAPGACLAPPTAGVSTVTPNNVCAGDVVSLDLTGNSIGLGQTYQWQSSTTLAGTYTNIGPVQTTTQFSVTANTTLYYRAVVTCSGLQTFSQPILVTVNPPLPGGTYTINKLAPPSATNFISFNAAYAAMSCGIAGPVVLNVSNGPYNEQLVMDSIRGASAINTITFNGNGNTIQFSSTDANERAVIKLRRADYVTFDSLNIDATGAGTYGFGVQLINNADNNTFRRCKITTVKNNSSTNYAGIVVNASESAANTTGATNCDNNLFEYNTVTGGYYGLTLVGAAATQIFNNVSQFNTFVDYYIYGTYINGASRTRIHANDYSRPTNTTVTTHYGVYMTTSALSDTVSNNKIHDPFKGNSGTTSGFYGVYMTAVDATAAEPNLVYNNVVYNVTGEGDQYGFYNSSSNYVKYYHNTLNFDDQTSQHTTTWWTRAFHQVTTPAGVEFKNNIITITRTGNGTRHAVYLASGPTGITLDNNDYYVTGGGPGGGAPAIGFNGTSQATLTAWQASTGQEANTKNFNPIYASPSTGNLLPLFGGVDNLGTPVGITFDIVNAARSATTPDVGAWEFAVPPCVNPPVAGAASVTPNTGICLGTPVTLDLTGNSSGGGQVYIWQSAPSASGPWTNFPDTLYFPTYNTFASTNSFFRAQVICSNGTPVFSTVTGVTLNPPLPPGVYTINNTLPTSGTNYNSFNDAVIALQCGISGHVFFDVAAGTYTEQVRMNPIGGSGDNARVTFRSANGNPASVILTFGPTTTATNYVLKLDSASYVTYKDITLTNTNTTNGRVIDFAGTASKDSILNCVVNAPVTTTASQNIVGIHADLLTGSFNVLKGNTINNGSAGIYFEGSSAAVQTKNNVIDSNTVTGSYQYGIYASFNERVKVTRNVVSRSGAGASSAYGIYGNNCDSAYNFSGNVVNMSNNTIIAYGMYINTCEALATERGLVTGNKITATTGNSSTTYGMYVTLARFASVLNNVISLNSSGATSYGLFSTSGFKNNYYNNTVHSTATSATTNVAAHFAHTSATTGGMDIRNNIFSHAGGGRAYSVSNPFFIYSDYNMLYTSGPTLVVWGSTALNTLQRWRDTTSWDINSIAFKPAFNSPTDLTPKLNDSTVWGMHGRGVQIAGNNYDFNNNPRPTTLTTGVPDLGAYEFLPTSIPFDLPATPAVPAAGITQHYMLGTDTVTKVTWNPGSPVPQGLKVKRYSGVLPTGLSAGQNSMYFYTDIDTIGNAALNFNMQQFYIDPWQGFISQQYRTRLGRTDAANIWLVGPNSTVDTSANVITENGLTYIDKFTGLEGAAIQPPPVVALPPDSSNRGVKFWVPYGHHQFFGSDNSQQMVLYLSTEQAAKVTVRINGTPYFREFNIPANTAITTPIIPKSGLYDARIMDEGLNPRGISIESDTPIVAYAHIYGSASSGATLLLPVGTYGYEYYATGFRQNYASNTYAWFDVVADRDSTVVEITPANPTLNGRPANVPFTVTLMKGEVYQVLGAIISGSNGYDLTGSRVKSVPNNAGNCYPFAMFSGSSRTSIYCAQANTVGNGDNLIQQNFPSQAWGKKYLTAPTSNSTAANSLHTNIYRVVVKDPATVVTRNGTALTGIINGRFYEFESNTADYIEADQPIMVSQYMASSGSNCANTSGNGDPEMFYLSPMEQAIKNVVLFRNNEENITINYLTLIIPTAGVASLTIDGSNTFDYTYAHPNLAGYTVVVKRWTAAQAQARVQSDSAFTAITYGEGSVESYGYNAGTLVKNLNAITSINNVFGTGNTPYTCAKTPFRFFMYLSVKPTVIEWKFSQVPNLTPNADVIQNNPTPIDSIFVNGRWLYRYTVAQDYTFSSPGTYYVPIFITHPTIESCNSRQEITLKAEVKPAAISDFTTVFSGCIGDAVQFNGTYTSPAGSSPTQWQWNFGDATSSTIQNPTKLYSAPGTYNVSLRAIGADGCIGDTVKPLVVNPRPVVNVTPDTLTVCLNANATWTVQNPVQGATYNWYTQATGGQPAGTGTSFTATNVTQTVVFYVEGVVNGCASITRKRVTAGVLPLLNPPVVVVDSLGATAIKFRWNAVAGATSYQVSTNNGGTWQTPSSGPTGLTHTVTGLVPLQTITLVVKALGGCRDTVSAPVTARTLTDQIYIPNAFSPNGDGLNDVLRVYGNIIRELRFVVFNQWGEKIFESRNQSQGWDGTYKGKQQPSGVYIYVCDLILNDGQKLQKKGSINLVR